MYITEVAPLVKIPLPSSQVLTYFTSQTLKEGSLVLIPLRKKEVPAIVMSLKEARLSKMEIKKMEFKLKPILKVIKKERALFPYQIKLAKWISDYYWSPFGKALSLFLPDFLIKKMVKGKVKISPFEFKKSARNIFKRELHITSLDFLPRGEIKKTLKKNQQILFLIPEKSKSTFWVKKFQQITNKICFFSADLLQKKYLENFKKIKDGEVKIIIGTRSSLFAPFSSLGLILISEEESKNYKSEMEPKYNAKDVAEKLANILGIGLILTSSLPAIEDYVRPEKIIWKKEESKKVEKVVIDMKNVSKISHQNVLEEWSPLSPSLLNEVKKNLSFRKKILLFINRKGEGLSVVCQDCGWIKKCKNCDVPLAIHREKLKKGKETLSMLCHHCGFRTSLPRECEQCKSWRLITLGSGIEKIERELKKKFKDSKILRLDSKAAPKHKTQKKILKEFFEKEADILITTSLIFQYLLTLERKKIPLVAVVSLDSLLSLPDFRSEEEGVRIVHKLLSFTLDKFIIQTLLPDSKIINFIKNDYDSFLKEEIAKRRRFSYPPFSKLVKLTFSHKNPEKAKSEAYLLRKKLNSKIGKLGKEAIDILGPAPAFIPKIKGKYIWKILIKLKPKGIHQKNNLLSIVPQRWKVDVEPMSSL